MITTYCKMSCSGAAQYYHNNVIARKIILIFISPHAWKSTERILTQNQRLSKHSGNR